MLTLRHLTGVFATGENQIEQYDRHVYKASGNVISLTLIGMALYVSLLM